MKPHARGLAVVENTVDIGRSPEDVFDYCVDDEPTRSVDLRYRPKAKTLPD